MLQQITKRVEVLTACFFTGVLVRSYFQQITKRVEVLTTCFSLVSICAHISRTYRGKRYCPFCFTKKNYLFTFIWRNLKVKIVDLTVDLTNPVKNGLKQHCKQQNKQTKS